MHWVKKMNKIYKLIWSSTLGQWVVCSELGKRTKNSSKKVLAIGALGLLSFSSQVIFAAACPTTTGSNGVTYWKVAANNLSCEIAEQVRPTSDVGWHPILQISGNNDTVNVNNTTNAPGSGNLTIDATAHMPHIPTLMHQGLVFSIIPA